ncbi:hypothetical protein Salmuc_00595 [Salipiger mucosus DSM 16094]|uniref:Uncharacterized protein n=1 Tax=Salipiger mucosus DSM 16094 TaxID=1123237 RepID=S9QZA2_9RHOB|nr:hypothetical protein Salmuc_00595 [Salipiger mucosus DSM 16094]
MSLRKELQIPGREFGGGRSRLCAACRSAPGLRVFSER